MEAVFYGIAHFTGIPKKVKCLGERKAGIFEEKSHHSWGELTFHASQHFTHTTLTHLFHHFLHLGELLEQTVHILYLGP